MKFIADTMLGRLTRWLRLSGYDVIYTNDMEDGRILRTAREDERIILTRDKELYENAIRNKAEAVLLKSNDFAERIRHLQKKLRIIVQDTPKFARCPVCNGEIVQIQKKDVGSEVPAKILEQVNEFWKCTECGKIYWHGGHWKNISGFVEKL